MAKTKVKRKSPNPKIADGRGMGTGKGKPKAIETPDKLWSLFEDYKTWSKLNPYLLHQYTDRKGKDVNQKRERAITFVGFEAYLDRMDIIHHLGNYEYDIDGRYTSYKPIIKKIKKACSDDILTGALGGVYNANLASRLEGLTDKQDIKVDDNRKAVADLFPFKNDKKDE